MENVQPFLFRHNTGDFALAHNGNIVNSELLRRHLENKGSLFQSTSDSEILAHLIKKETRYHDRPRIFSIIDALNMLEGAFAFLIMTANRIYACRDKYGLRPLAIGRLGDGWVVSSETCAFDVLGAEFVRDVEPGEIVTIDSEGIRSRDFSQYKRCEMCSMEYIYFARPDSDIEGCNVHAYRKESGRLLFGEALVLVNDALKPHFRNALKQRGGMLAKGRLLGVQFQAFFENDLWLELARHADRTARQLERAFEKKGYGFYAAPCTNQLFPILPDRKIEELRSGFDFELNAKTCETHTAVRFVTSWATTLEAIEALERAL